MKVRSRISKEERVSGTPVRFNTIKIPFIETPEANTIETQLIEINLYLKIGGQTQYLRKGGAAHRKSENTI